MFANHKCDNGITPKVCKEYIQHKSKKPRNNPIFKWAKTPNKLFSKEDTQMAKQHIKTCSMQLCVKKIQIKTTVRYHLTPVRMAITQKSKDNKSW